MRQCDWNLFKLQHQRLNNLVTLKNRQAVLSKVFQQNHSSLGNISENGSVKFHIKIFQTVAEKTAKNFMGLLYSAAICILYIHDEIGLETQTFICNICNIEAFS